MKPDEPEIPDLVLEVSTPAAPPRASAAASRSATPMPASGTALRGTWGASQGDGLEIELGSVSLPNTPAQRAGGAQLPPSENEFDLFADDLGMTDLGLDLETGIAPEAQPTPGPRHSGAPARASERAPRVWPTGRTAVAEELAIDPLEVSIAASYGRPPRSPVLAPGYALRVFTQCRRLLPEEQAARQRLDQAEKARDRLLVELAESARPALEANDRMRTVLSALNECESLTSERNDAFSRASADVAGTEGELDAKLASIAVEQELARQEGEAVRALADRAEEAVRRLEVQDKRIEIERRSVLDVARHKLGPAGGALPQELAQKLSELDARKAALSPDLESMRRERDAARRDLDASQSKLRALTRESRLLSAAKQDYKARQQGELDVRAQGLSEAEEQRRLALVGVGQRVLELRGEVPVDEERLDALTRADDAVARALLDAEKLRRALYSYDHDAEKQGRVILIALAALCVLGVLIAIFT